MVVCNKREESSKRLLVIDVIKMLSAFLVVCHHFGHKTIFYDKITLLAVPIFMILSFMFLFKKLNKDFDIYRRIKKLFVPLFGSAVIYYIVYNFILNRNIFISDFLWQTTFGHSPKLNQTMWFSNNLIFLTIFVYIFRKYFIKYPVISSIITLIISYILQYSGYNVLMFSGLREELKAPLGRLVEMLPFVAAGCLVARYNFREFFSKKKIILFIVGSYILLKLLKIHKVNGFAYSGFGVLFKSLFALICVNIVPFQKLSTSIQVVLSGMCKYTLGIYCFHRLTESCIHNFLARINISETIYSCLIIYILTYGVCYLISKIPSKWTRMLVE